MRLRFRDIKKIVWLCGAICFLVSLHILSVYLFAIHRFTVSYDTVASEKAQAIVEDYIRITKLYESTSAELLAEKLQAQFPFIHKVSCRYAPSGLHVCVKLHTPLVRLSKNKVVTANNYCVPCDYFVQSAYMHLPSLRASIDQDQLPGEMFNYLTSIDLGLFKYGEINWRHNNEIVCQLYEQPMRLICNYQKKPTHEVVASCRAIAHDLKNQPFLITGFSADVRFSDRIVVAKLRNEGA